MAVSNLQFMADVDEWTKQTEQRLTAVFRESSQRVVSAAQENLRTVVNVRTGFLRASVRASTEAMPPIDSTAYPAEGGHYDYDDGQISTVIASAEIGQSLYFGWTAAYAAYVNYGTVHMAPRRYVDLAAEQWQIIVNGVVQEAKSRV